MTSALNYGANHTANFEISLRAGVWQVHRNQVFYGDYLSRQQAMRSACSAARSYEASGGAAVVRTASDGALVAHQSYDLNPVRPTRARSPR